MCNISLIQILGRSVRMIDSQIPADRIGAVARIVVPVIDLTVNDLLNCLVLCCINSQAACIKQVVCLCVGISCLRLKVIDQIIYQGIDKVGIQGVTLALCIITDTGIDILCPGCIILFLRDVAVLQHSV